MFADDYFLSNVKTVDDVTEERKRRLLGVAQWKAGLQTSVGTWPCFNVITDLPADEKQEKLCAACDKSQVSVRVQMYGQPYNSTTLEGCQPDPKVANQKVSKFVAVSYFGLFFKTLRLFFIHCYLIQYSIRSSFICSDCIHLPPFCPINWPSISVVLVPAKCK
jgi:hypothetical protein